MYSCNSYRDFVFPFLEVLLVYCVVLQFFKYRKNLRIHLFQSSWFTSKDLETHQALPHQGHRAGQSGCEVRRQGSCLLSSVSSTAKAAHVLGATSFPHVNDDSSVPPSIPDWTQQAPHL